MDKFLNSVWHWLGEKDHRERLLAVVAVLALAGTLVSWVAGLFEGEPAPAPAPIIVISTMMIEDLYQRPYRLTCAHCRVVIVAMAAVSFAKKFHAVQHLSTISS